MIIRQEFFSKLIFCIEQSCPVNTATWQGTHLWPFYRIALMSIVNQIDYAPYCRNIENKYDQICPKPPADCDAHEVAPQPGRASDVGGGVHLFYGSEDDHFLTTPDGWAAPVIDAWVDLAADMGGALKVEFLRPDAVQHRVRTTAMIPLPPRDDIAACGRELRDDADFQAAARALDQMVAAAAESWAPGLASALAFSFTPFFAEILVRKRVTDRLLDSLRPSSASVVCWYSIPQSALVWACNARGIPTIEILHCGAPEFHHGYSHLSAVPPDGYHALPRTFLCWDHPSANAIMRWIPPGSRAAHRATAGGLPPRLPAGRGRAPGGAAAAELDRLLTAGTYAKRILVGLGGDEPSGFVPAFVDIIRHAPRDWLWLIRSHPLHPVCVAPNIRPDQVRAILAEHGIGNCDTDLATACPLPEVLSRVDHHLTVMSTLAFDAFHYGVPTTFVGSMAPALYGWLRDRRVAYFEHDPAAVVASVEDGLRRLDAARFKTLSRSEDPGASRRAFLDAARPQPLAGVSAMSRC